MFDENFYQKGDGRKNGQKDDRMDRNKPVDSSLFQILDVDCLSTLFY